jgi:hypothetical protein
VTGATTWHGRRGPVVLGPTEHRVARWLADMTRHGRATIRTVDLARDCRVERSEAYRITRRLRVLGLFGIENDRAGTRGGRRYWRTPIQHDAADLDPQRHRAAWARLVGWAQAKRGRLGVRLAALRHHTRDRGVWPAVPASGRAVVPALIDAGPGSLAPPPADDPGPTFAASMRRAGLGPLMDAWGVR